jgi:hypothetical protein
VGLSGAAAPAPHPEPPGGEGGVSKGAAPLWAKERSDCCKGGFLGRRSLPEQGPGVANGAKRNVATSGSLVLTVQHRIESGYEQTQEHATS